MKSTLVPPGRTHTLGRMFPQLSQFDLHHRIASNSAPTLVFFSSRACGSCRQLKQALETVRHNRPAWLIYEVDAEREGGLVREFEVFHLPAIFLFKDGDFHCEISSLATPEALEAAVEAALAQPPGEAP